jgi:hypothetical protein
MLCGKLHIGWFFETLCFSTMRSLSRLSKRILAACSVLKTLQGNPALTKGAIHASWATLHEKLQERFKAKNYAAVIAPALAAAVAAYVVASMLHRKGSARGL